MKNEWLNFYFQITPHNLKKNKQKKHENMKTEKE